MPPKTRRSGSHSAHSSPDNGPDTPSTVAKKTGKKEWPKTPRFTEGPVPLNVSHPPTDGLRGAFQYRCICDPKKAFLLSHFYECGVQKWDRQLISHIQHCVEDALFWYKEKGALHGDEQVPFQ
eukprot:scaffold20004_cov122-Amphora_coffeaeformis.AAC.1